LTLLLGFIDSSTRQSKIDGPLGFLEDSLPHLLLRNNSKDDPRRPQIKVMTGSLDPLGMPLATDVLSGERADDGLDIPLIERMKACSLPHASVSSLKMQVQPFLLEES